MFGFELTSQHYTVVYAYWAPVLGLLILLTLIKTNHLFSQKQSRFFVFAVCINLVLIVASCIDYLISTQAGEGLWMIRRVTSATHFALAPFLPVALMHLYERKRLSLLKYVPVIINFVVCVLSMMFKLVFFIDTNNKYSRGPLFFVPLLVTIIYILMLVANPLITLRRTKRREMMYILTIVAMVMMCILLDVAFHFQFLEYACSAIGLIMYYLLQNIHYFASDPLTGVSNRQMYTHMLRNIAKTPHCFFALVDLNDFKAINDTLGHDAGDKALVQFAVTLGKHIESFGVIYRIGGDEFMIVAKRVTKDEFTQALQRAFAESMQENNLGFAYGMEEYNAGDNVEAMLIKVDKGMYAQKASMKKSPIAADTRQVMAPID